MPPEGGMDSDLDADQVPLLTLMALMPQMQQLVAKKN
jgi:hypothetical protein